MGVSKNNGTPKSSILIGFSLINHPFWWFSPYFWVDTHMCMASLSYSSKFDLWIDLPIMQPWCKKSTKNYDTLRIIGPSYGGV